MIFRKSLLAIAGLFCVCSLTSADDFVLDHVQGQSSFIVASNQGSRAAVSSLPGGVFGDSTAEVTSSLQQLEIEEKAIQRANFLVLSGIAGFLLAAVSATVLFFAYRKRSRFKSANAGMQLVGI